MIAATDRGLLFVFPGALHNQMDREHSLAGEQVEAKHMIKVAHEVGCISLCVFCCLFKKNNKNTTLCINYTFIHFLIQDCITSLSCNDKGSLIISGGTDGKVCIWHWGRDEFLHRAGEIYITNLPIQSAKVKVNSIGKFQHQK